MFLSVSWDHSDFGTMKLICLPESPTPNVHFHPVSRNPPPPFGWTTVHRVTLKYIALQKEAVRSMWDSDWLPNISGKQALYKGLAQYHQSKVAAEQKEIGEEIAR